MPEFSILIVDDEANVLAALHRLFRANKRLQVHTATDARSGVEVLRKNDIDLVISDERMPEVEGHKFLAYLRKNFPDVVRIMLSGYAEQDAILDAINKGEVYRFITKPWNNHELMITIEKALEHGRLAKENRKLAEELKKKNRELSEINKTLELKVKQRTEELEKAMLQISSQRDAAQNGLADTATFLTSMVGLIRKDIRDHVKRIADTAQKVVRELKLPAAEVQPIIMASYFHELGRFGGSTEDGEDEEKTSELSEHLIRSVLKMTELAEIVRHYRENWDGSGSPDNLKEEKIPIGSRILRVCKDYDHMLYIRNNNSAETEDFLIQHSGIYYDRDVVAALLSKVKNDDKDGKWVKVTELKDNMVLYGNVYLESGVLFLPANTVVDENVTRRIEDFAELIDMEKQVYVKLLK